MKSKIIITFAVVVFLVPQVTFAAWWNPFSWKVFNKAPEAVLQKKIDVPSDQQKTLEDERLGSITKKNTQEETMGEISVTEKVEKSLSLKKKIITPLKEDESLSTEKKDVEKKTTNQALAVEKIKKTSTPPVKKITTPENKSIAAVQEEKTTITKSVDTAPPHIDTWEELESKYFPEADQKQWPGLVLTNKAGEERYYRKENGIWVRKNSEAESSQPWSPPLPSVQKTTQCSSGSTECAGQCWSVCPSGQQFSCTTTGAVCINNPITQQPPTSLPTPPVTPKSIQCSSGLIKCVEKCWLPCLDGQNFVCDENGARCLIPSLPPAPTTQPADTISRDTDKLVKLELESTIDKWNDEYEKYKRQQAEIDAKVKPLQEKFNAIFQEQEKKCPTGEFYTGQLVAECRQYTFRLNDINRQISEVTGIYPNISSLPKYSLPAPERWIIDGIPGGTGGKIWSPNSGQKYEYTCSQYSCDISSY